MKITKLVAENIKRLKAVAIEFDTNGGVTIISGRNNQGKSSVLDAIWYALAGDKVLPSEPIRHGTEKGVAQITTDTGLVVTKTFTGKGAYLKVESADGATYKSPQTMLNGLLGMLTFDPLEFSRLDARKRREVLLQIASIPIDLAEHAKARKDLEERRRDIGRDVKQLDAQLAGMRAPNGAPADEVSVADLAAAVQTEMAKQQANADRARRIQSLERDVQIANERVQDLIQKLAGARSDLGANQQALVAAQATPEQAVDIDGAQTRLAGAEQHNTAARAAKAYHELADKVTTMSAQHGACEAALKALDDQKTRALANAAMPIPGLSVGDDEVTFNEVPFAQLSSSQQLKVSLAMAMALNPKLRMIRIADGSLLDSESMSVVEQMARERDYQVLVEVVDESGKVGIVIEDGEVLDATAEL